MKKIWGVLLVYIDVIRHKKEQKKYSAIFKMTTSGSMNDLSKKKILNVQIQPK